MPLELCVLSCYIFISLKQIQDWQIKGYISYFLSFSILIIFMSLEFGLINLGFYIDNEIEIFSDIMIPIYISYGTFVLIFIYALPGLLVQSERTALIIALYIIGTFGFFLLLKAKIEYQNQIIN